MTRILHVSDLHVDAPLGELPLSTWLSKRALGGVNHALRRRSHFLEAEAKLAKLGVFASTHAVDLALCTGDYTILGTELEHDVALRAIAPLTTRPLGFVTVPGNHDVYLRDAIDDGRFARRFGAWTRTELSEHATASGFPFVRFVGEHVAIVGVTSVRPNPEPWRSSGLVPEAELVKLRAILGDPRVAERFVVVMTHYAPRLWNGLPDSRSHGLDNADAFLAELRAIRRGVLLHGHVHRRYAVELPGTSIRALCAGSSTQAGREGLWVLDVDGTSASATPGAYRDGSYVLEAEPLRLA